MRMRESSHDLKNMADYHKERTNTKAFERRKRRDELLPQDHKRLLRRDKCWKKTEERGETTMD